MFACRQPGAGGMLVGGSARNGWLDGGEAEIRDLGVATSNGGHGGGGGLAVGTAGKIRNYRGVGIPTSITRTDGVGSDMGGDRRAIVGWVGERIPPPMPRPGRPGCYGEYPAIFDGGYDERTC